MIGKAFLQLGDPAFINLLGEQVYLPVPQRFAPMFAVLNVKTREEYKVSSSSLASLRNDKLPEGVLAKLKSIEGKPYIGKDRFAEAVRELLPEDSRSFEERIVQRCREETVNLNEMLRVAAGSDAAKRADYQERVGKGVQRSINHQFEKYELTGMTWKALTRSSEPGAGGHVAEYVNAGGTGLLKRGADRYQLLVPAYTVMFSFFLVLMAGWIFVSERRQGTLKRLRAAAVTRAEVLIGKLIPCLALSLVQGILLLVLGKLAFGMRWGPDSWTFAEQVFWLLPVVCCTSLAAMGLAMLVASLAHTEMQVALYGAIPVLILALLGGCVLPRALMPEHTQTFALLSPHGWALQAYAELLDPNPLSQPNLGIVVQSCGVLAAFGIVTLGLAWWTLRLD
jgi:ABC-type multidrug transport system permease subunit